MIRSVSVFQPVASSTGTTPTKRLQSITVAKEAGFPFVRFNLELRYLAPSVTGRVYDWLDQQITWIKANDQGILLGLTYGPQGGDWVSSDEKFINASDHTNAKNAILDGLSRIFTYHNFDKRKVYFQLWNEADNTNFGAFTNGVIASGLTIYMTMVASAVKHAYPEIPLIAPSLSQYSSGFNWITATTNITSAQTYLSYCDYLAFHFYPNFSTPQSFLGEGIVRQTVVEGVKNIRTRVASAYPAIANKPWFVTECGFQFENAGLNGSYWTYGNEEERSRYTLAMINTLGSFPFIKGINVYNAMNSSSAYDVRTDTNHFGLCNSNGRPYSLFRDCALMNGVIPNYNNLPGSGGLHYV